MVDLGLDIRIPQRRWHYQIYWPAQQSFQSLLQTEIGIQRFDAFAELEVNKEIEIAFVFFVFTNGGGAEKLQPHDAEAPAELLDLRTIFQNEGMHETDYDL